MKTFKRKPQIVTLRQWWQTKGCSGCIMAAESKSKSLQLTIAVDFTEYSVTFFKMIKQRISVN